MDAVGQVIPLADFRKQKFLEWLCTPPKERTPRTQAELAEELGLDPDTLTRWKLHDVEFLREWERCYLAGIGSPERKQNIMDTLYRTASDQDDPKHVQAAKTYFEIEGSMKPQKVQVEVSKVARDLTDAELNDLLAMKAAEVKAQRDTG